MRMPLSSSLSRPVTPMNALLVLYGLAWLSVIWIPFTWFMIGLMLFAQLCNYISERIQKIFTEKSIEAFWVIWLIFPFVMQAVYLCCLLLYWWY